MHVAFPPRFVETCGRRDGAPCLARRRRRAMQRRLVLALTMMLAAACSTTPKEVARPEPEAPPATPPAPPAAEAKAPEPEPQKVLIALKRVHFGLGSAKLNAASRAAL